MSNKNNENKSEDEILEEKIAEINDERISDESIKNSFLNFLDKDLKENIKKTKRIFGGNINKEIWYSFAPQKSRDPELNAYVVDPSLPPRFLIGQSGKVISMSFKTAKKFKDLFKKHQGMFQKMYDLERQMEEMDDKF